MDVKINALEQGEKHVYSLPHFKLDNVYPIFEKYFNDKAKAAMANKAVSFHHSYNLDPEHHEKLFTLLSRLELKTAQTMLSTKQIYRVGFDTVRVFGVSCDRPDMVKAIERMIVSINHLADKGFLRASMVELGVIKFAHVLGKPDEVAVLSYLSLSKKGEQYVAQNMSSIITTEGCVPTRLEKL